jgi:CelD/BcsL family acetyltransferase involved in cellulose biosynthesis
MMQPGSTRQSQDEVRGAPRPSPGPTLRQVRPAELSPGDLAAWLDLEARALEPNAYLSPHFVVPALRHLGAAADTVVAFLEEAHLGVPTLQAVAVLQPSGPTRAMPLPHRRAYLSPHSYLSGVLVAREEARRHLEALCHLRWGRSGHGLVLESCRVDGPTDRLLRDLAAESGMGRSESNAYQRAAMRPAEMGEAYLGGPLKSRDKKVRAHRRKLEAQGTVGFEVLRGPAIDEAAIERHLALEHMGWKGQAGTSLRSIPAHQAFFREMAAAFAAADRALFAQLSVDGQVIASSSNFLAGDTGFAFKIGFDPGFSQFAPGIMCEMEFLRGAPQLAGELEAFDSGATAGSYLEELWPERRLIATVAYSTSVPGRLALACQDRLRRIKQAMRGRAAAGAP